MPPLRRESRLSESASLETTFMDWRAPHRLIAREGWGHLGLAVGAAVVATLVVPAYSPLFWLLAVFVAQFFREPERVPPSGDGLCVSPADGRVVKVCPAEDPQLGRRAVQVSIFMNVFNVHANRIPEHASVKSRVYRAGSFANAALDKASAGNEANALVLQTDDGQDITVVQIAGLIARRIFCYVDRGDRVRRGQRYGFIRFGSRVDVYLPPDSTVEVALGDHVTGGVDVIARLPRRDETL